MTKRWMFEIPGVVFDRPWRFGRILFQPPGVAAREVREREDQTSAHTSWAVAHELSSEVAERWDGSSTLDVVAEESEEAELAALEHMAVLRFLMREVVLWNVDFHRIGLSGEVVRRLREYLVFFGGDRVGTGWSALDTPVEFRFTDDMIAKWEDDSRVHWLSSALGTPSHSRPDTARRVMTALTTVDRAFLSKDVLASVVLYAAAVEVLFGDRIEDTPSGLVGKVLRVASRVAYVTCGNGCAATRPACPYVLGFARQRQLWETASQWSAAGEEWRCSAFLNIARPPDMDQMCNRKSLFGARNEAVHEGTTSLSIDDLRWMRSLADRAIRGFLTWIVERPGATVELLDAEVHAGAARLGSLRPGA